MMDYKYEVINSPYASPRRSIKRIAKFGDYDFMLGSNIEEIDYGPRLYPIYDFEDIMPEDVKSVIKLLDKYPECNGYPIFDNFWVLVPGVAYPENCQSSFYDETGMIRDFNSMEDAYKALDKIFLKGQHVVGAVLGEVDGKLYFISYWI